MQMSLMTFMAEVPVLFGPGSVEEKSDRLENLLRDAAAAGFQRVDLTQLAVSLLTKEKVRTLTEELDLQVNCIIYVGVAEGIGQCEEVVQMAEYLACDKLMLVPGMGFGPDKEANYRTITDAFRRVLACTAGKNITCVIEDDPNIALPMCTRAEMHRIFTELPDLRLVYDTANMLAVGEEPVGYFREFAAVTRHMHIKDMQIAPAGTPGGPTGVDGRVYLNSPHGQGLIPFTELFAAFKEAGYNGTYALEFVPRQDLSLVDDLKHCHDMFAEYESC